MMISSQNPETNNPETLLAYVTRTSKNVFKCFFRASVNDVNLAVYVDTGNTGMRCIAADFARAVNINHKNTRSAPIKNVVIANGTTMPTSGVATIDLGLSEKDNLSITIDVLVLEGLAMDLNLSGKTLWQNNIDILYSLGQLKYKGFFIPLYKDVWCGGKRRTTKPKTQWLMHLRQAHKLLEEEGNFTMHSYNEQVLLPKTVNMIAVKVIPFQAEKFKNCSPFIANIGQTFLNKYLSSILDDIDCNDAIEYFNEQKTSIDDEGNAEIAVINPWDNYITISNNTKLGTIQPMLISTQHLNAMSESTYQQPIREDKYYSMMNTCYYNDISTPNPKNIHYLMQVRNDKFLNDTYQSDIESKNPYTERATKANQQVTGRAAISHHKQGLSDEETLLSKYGEYITGTISNKVLEKRDEKAVQQRKKYVYDLFKLDNSPFLNKHPKLKEKVHKLCYNFFDIHGKDGNLGTTSLVTYQIHTPKNTAPIRCKVRPINPRLEADLQKQIDKWLKEGVIRESSDSPWNSPILPIIKKNGKIRYALDYRKLNLITRKNAYPLPNIDEIFSNLYGAKVLSTLDISQAFHAIPVDKKDQEKLAFSVNGKQYAFQRLSFGLCNAPSKFSELMSKVMQPFQRNEAIHFMDDIILLSKTPQEHVQLLERMFKALRAAGLRITPSKTELFKKEVLYLGYIISENSLKVPKYYTDIITEWPLPKTVKELRAYLGKIGYYRKFIKNFSRVTGRLFDYVKVDLEKKPDLQLDKDQEAVKAFEESKQALVDATALTIPDFSGSNPFILDTDFSSKGISACLSQVQDGIEKPIGFAGKRLLPRQANYSSTRGELLALIFGIQQFKFYLLAGKFIIRVDNTSLTYLRTMEQPKGLESRWLEILACYDFEIKHRSGKSHTNADTLSRVAHSKLLTKQETDELLMENQLCAIRKIARPRRERKADITMKDLLMEDDDAIKNSIAERVKAARRKKEIIPIFEKSKAKIDVQNKNEMKKGKIQKGNDTTHFTNICNNENHSSVNTEDCVKSQKSEPLARQDNDQNIVKLREEHNIVHFRDLQNTDDELSQVRTWIKMQKKPAGALIKLLSRNLRSYVNIFELLTFDKNDILCKKDPDTETLKRCVPQLLQEQVVEELHNIAHAGETATIHLVQNRYHFPALTQTVKLIVTTCPRCQQKQRHNKTQKHTYETDVYCDRFQNVSIDHVGKLPMSPKGNSYLLTVLDRYTRWLEAFPVSDLTAHTAAKTLLDQYFSRYGLPRTVHSDNGAAFVAGLFKEVMRSLRVKVTTTPTYNPCSNPVERSHLTLSTKLKALMHETKCSWEDALPAALMSLRSSVNRATGFSPYYMLFGMPMTLPVDLAYGSPPSGYKGTRPAVRALLNTYQKMYKKVRDMCITTIERTIEDYNDEAQILQIGQLVWLFCPKPNPDFARKFKEYWSGPWQITSKVSTNLYRIKTYGNWATENLEHTVAADRLRICHIRDKDLNYGLPINLTMDDVTPYGQPDEARVPMTSLAPHIRTVEPTHETSKHYGSSTNHPQIRPTENLQNSSSRPMEQIRTSVHNTFCNHDNNLSKANSSYVTNNLQPFFTNTIKSQIEENEARKKNSSRAKALNEGKPNGVNQQAINTSFEDEPQGEADATFGKSKPFVSFNPYSTTFNFNPQQFSSPNKINEKEDTSDNFAETFDSNLTFTSSEKAPASNDVLESNARQKPCMQKEDKEVRIAGNTCNNTNEIIQKRLRNREMLRKPIRFSSTEYEKPKKGILKKPPVPPKQKKVSLLRNADLNKNYLENTAEKQQEPANKEIKGSPFSPETTKDTRTSMDGSISKIISQNESPDVYKKQAEYYAKQYELEQTLKEAELKSLRDKHLTNENIKQPTHTLNSNQHANNISTDGTNTNTSSDGTHPKVKEQALKQKKKGCQQCTLLKKCSLHCGKCTPIFTCSIHCTACSKRQKCGTHCLLCTNTRKCLKHR